MLSCDFEQALPYQFGARSEHGEAVPLTNRDVAAEIDAADAIRPEHGRVLLQPGSAFRASGPTIHPRVGRVEPEHSSLVP